VFSLSKYSWVFKAADVSSIAGWIDANVDYPKNNCFFYAAVLSLLYDLKLIRGRYEYQRKDDRRHFWTEDKDGIRYDPTAHQYQKGGKYSGGEEVDPLNNMTEIVKHKMFRRLSKADQKAVISKINKMSFPEDEEDSIKEYLDTLGHCYTTRVKKERGKYLVGNIYIAPWGDVLKIDKVKLYGALWEHPFLQDLTEDMKKQIGDHKYEVIKFSRFSK